MKFDLELSLGEADGRIVGGLGYASALFDEATIERHRGYLVAMLRAMVARRGAGGGDASSCSEPAERTLLLESGTQTEAAYPSERCIHELFEEQVAKHAGRGGGGVRRRAADVRES